MMIFLEIEFELLLWNIWGSYKVILLFMLWSYFENPNEITEWVLSNFTGLSIDKLLVFDISYLRIFARLFCGVSAL